MPTQTITELFALDPINLTKEDRTRIIEYYREKREQFNSGQNPDNKKAPIDLAELGL